MSSTSSNSISLSGSRPEEAQPNNPTSDNLASNDSSSSEAVQDSSVSAEDAQTPEHTVRQPLNPPDGARPRTPAESPGAAADLSAATQHTPAKGRRDHELLNQVELKEILRDQDRKDMEGRFVKVDVQIFLDRFLPPGRTDDATQDDAAHATQDDDAAHATQEGAASGPRDGASDTSVDDPQVRALHNGDNNALHDGATNAPLGGPANATRDYRSAFSLAAVKNKCQENVIQAEFVSACLTISCDDLYL